MLRRFSRLANRCDVSGEAVEHGSAIGEVLIEVWRQAFTESAKVVVIESERYPILRISKRKLRQVDFKFDGQAIRGLEQNPDTKSRWAAMARQGKRVMQFLVGGRYVAVVVDGEAKVYVRRDRR